MALVLTGRATIAADVLSRVVSTFRRERAEPAKVTQYDRACGMLIELSNQIINDKAEPPAVDLYDNHLSMSFSSPD